MNKKAISTLVATVLLVLITIAAVGIIWGAIMPIIRSNLETSQACSAAGVSIDTSLGYTYQTGNDVKINVVKDVSSATELKGILLEVMKSDGTSATNKSADVPTSSEPRKIYTISLKAGENATRVGVAAIIALGNLNYTCPMTETDLPK